MKYPVIVILTLLMTAISLTACNQKSADPSDFTPARGCHSARPAVVNPILDTALSDPVENINRNVTVCAYPGNKGPLSATIRFQEDATREQFRSNRKGANDAEQPITNLADIADEAYGTVIKGTPESPDLHTVVARKGALEVLITSTASIEKEAALARVLLN